MRAMSWVSSGPTSPILEGDAGRGVVALGIGLCGCSGFCPMRSSLLRGGLGHFSTDPLVAGRGITVSSSAHVEAYGSRWIRMEK